MKEFFVVELVISYVFMNWCGKINVRKGFEKDYNFYIEFFEWEIEVYVFVKWMEFLGM